MRLSEQIGDIAQRILGPPNKALSTRHQFRFGTNGSVAVDISGPKTGTYFNHETHKGGGWRELLLFEGGIAQEDVEEWLEREGFGARAHRRASSLNAKVIATYDYHDENGVLLFQVCRLHPKTFLQRRPDGSGGWTWKVKGVRQIPYRLPELIVAAAKRNSQPPRVFIPEGEKDVDRLREWGLLATTNPGGAGKWRLEYSKYLTGFDVVLLPDNDDAGRQHAHHVAQCLRDNAASVRIVELGGLPEKGDVSDWIDGGASQSDFETLLDLCPPFEFGNTLDDPIPPQFSDEALALEFSSLHADKLRYVALWGKWVLWGATHWQREETLKAFDLARAVCRAASAQITDPKAIKLATGIASARTVAAVVSLARADRRHASTTEQWNSDDWLFNPQAPRDDA